MYRLRLRNEAQKNILLYLDILTLKKGFQNLGRILDKSHLAISIQKCDA